MFRDKLKRTTARPYAMDPNAPLNLSAIDFHEQYAEAVQDASWLRTGKRSAIRRSARAKATTRRFAKRARKLRTKGAASFARVTSYDFTSRQELKPSRILRNQGIVGSLHTAQLNVRNALLARRADPARVAAPNAMRASCWIAWFDKLESCRSLSDGWNGYTAAAPAITAIDNAEAFLRAMQQAGCEPTRVAPSAMGGIAITRRNDRKKVLVEFYNDGRAFSLFSTPPSYMNVKQVPLNAASFAAFIGEIQEYLDG